MQHCTGANIPNGDEATFENESKYIIALFYFLLPSFPHTFHAVASTKILRRNISLEKVRACMLISTCINDCMVNMGHKLNHD